MSTISPFQMGIIIDTADILRTSAKPDIEGYKVIADYELSEKVAIRLAFEDDAVVYIYVGTREGGRFWSSGAEVTLNNVDKAVVLATVKALAGV